MARGYSRALVRFPERDSLAARAYERDGRSLDVRPCACAGGARCTTKEKGYLRAYFMTRLGDGIFNSAGFVSCGQLAL